MIEIPWNHGRLRHSAILDRVGRSVKLGACGLGSCLGVKSLPFPIHRIGRHELLLPLLNQQEVECVVVITDNHNLVWPRAV